MHFVIADFVTFVTYRLVCGYIEVVLRRPVFRCRQSGLGHFISGFLDAAPCDYIILLSLYRNLFISITSKMLLHVDYLCDHVVYDSSRSSCHTCHNKIVGVLGQF